MSCIISIPEGGIVISRQSLQTKRKMFSISRSQRNENCRNGGVAQNLILQSRWLWSRNTGCSYLFLTTTPSLCPRTPLHPFAGGITRWIPLWIEALMSCSSLSALPPLSLLIFQFFLSSPPQANHVQLDNCTNYIEKCSGRALVGYVLKGSRRGPCMCVLVGGFSHRSPPLG